MSLVALMDIQNTEEVRTDINSPILCGNRGGFPEEFQGRTDLSLKVAHSSVGPSQEVPDISSQTMEDIYSAIDSS